MTRDGVAALTPRWEGYTPDEMAVLDSERSAAWRREPEEVLLRAAQDVMREAGRTLRQRGWPVELIVDRVPERDSFAVSLRFELPPIPVPMEADRG